MGASPYPVAYKKAAAGYPAPGLSNKPVPKPLRPPAKMPKVPVPANQNFPLAAGGKLLGKAASRAVPYLGTALLLYDLWKMMQPTGGQPAALPPGDWTLDFDCGNGAHPFLHWRSAAMPCGIGNYDPAQTPEPDWNTLQEVRYRVADGWHVGGKRWVRGATGTDLVPVGFPPLAPPHPLIRPWADPAAIPVTHPAPALVPAPAPGKGLAPEPGMEPSNKPTPAKNPRPEVFPLPAFPLTPGTVPAILTPPNVSPGPGEAPSVPVVPRPVIITPQPDGSLNIDQPPVTAAPPRKPPGKNTWEGKARKAHKIAGVRIAVNYATEGGDLINSIYKGTPHSLTKAKCHPRDYQCQLEKIYDEFNAINIAAALAAFINNQVEDMVYGLLGQQVKDASRNLNIDTGLSRAVSGGQYGEAQTDFEGQDQTQPLPTLHYDEVTGEFWVSWELFGLVGSKTKGSLSPRVGEVLWHPGR